MAARAPAVVPRAGAALVAAAALMVAVAMGLVAPAPVGAHARIVGSSPEDGATDDRVPDEVAIEVDAKPATTEGDPLQVYAPDGRRVDLGDTRASQQGRRLTVSITRDRQLPGGEYQVAYRVVSADSHVITGRLSFTARIVVAGEGAVAAAAAAEDRAGAGSTSLIPGRPGDLRAPLVAVGALALAALTLLVGWRRWAHAGIEAAAASRSRRTAPRRSTMAAAQGAPPRLGARDRVRTTRAHRPPRPRRRGGGPHARGPAADRRTGASVERAFWGEGTATAGRRRARRPAPGEIDAWWLDDEDGTWP